MDVPDFSSPSDKNRCIRYMGPLGIITVFILLTLWSWRSWPDILIDFGRALYIQWQLSLGKVLYADIAFDNGPLSQYINALWFKLFDVSISTLIYCNLAIFAILVFLIYQIFKHACGSFCATISCFVLLCVFGFSQYVSIGNYNYICPYSHEQTHGITLCVAMIYFFMNYLKSKKFYWCGLAGVCYGMIFLTKIEITIAATAATFLGLNIILFTSKPVNTRRILLNYSIGALIPILFFFIFLWTRLPFETVLQGLFMNVTTIFDNQTMGSTFYRAIMGTDHPKANLTEMVREFAGISGIIVFTAGIDILFRRIQKWRLLLSTVLGALAFIIMTNTPFQWLNAGSSLPLVSLITSLIFIIICFRYRQNHSFITRFAPLAIWAFFSLVLLLKIVLNTHIFHYGFVLAMPAALMLVACLCCLIPSVLAKKFARGDMFRAIMIALIFAGVLSFLQISSKIYIRKTLAIGKGGDLIYTFDPTLDPMGWCMKEIIITLKSLMNTDETLLVLPEGALINYLLRRDNPTKHTVFVPILMNLFGGEKEILNDIKSHPPDYIVYLHRPMTEFGAGYFGVDCGKIIMDWVKLNYVPVKTFSPPLVKGAPYGIAILKKSSNKLNTRKKYTEWQSLFTPINKRRPHDTRS